MEQFHNMQQRLMNGQFNAAELHDAVFILSRMKQDRTVLNLIARIVMYPEMHDETMDLIIGSFGKFESVQAEIPKRLTLTPNHLLTFITENSKDFTGETLSKVFHHPNITEELIILLCEPEHRQRLTLNFAARNTFTPADLLKEIFYTDQLLRHDVISHPNTPTKFLEALLEETEMRKYYRMRILKALHKKEKYKSYPYEWVDTAYS